MHVYKSTELAGHSPVGTAALVIAPSLKRAVKLLNQELKAQGLPSGATCQNVEQVSVNIESVAVLCDGNY